jgi:carbon monoxide dehydrogenase subunit G
VKLRNEFFVDADVTTVWAHLLDMEGVAACMPGATIEEVVEPGVYKGTIRVRIGPMTVDYRGQATLVEVDESAYTATMHLQAREQKGAGSAVAVVQNRLEAVPQGTRVVAETDLQITGPQAQFGKGMLEDVGGRVMVEFTRRLEEQIKAASPAAEPTASDDSGVARPVPGASRRDDEVLDLGRMLSESMAGKVVRAATVIAVIVAVVALLCRARRH